MYSVNISDSFSLFFFLWYFVSKYNFHMISIKNSIFCSSWRLQLKSEKAFRYMYNMYFSQSKDIQFWDSSLYKVCLIKLLPPYEYHSFLFLRWVNGFSFPYQLHAGNHHYLKRFFSIIGAVHKLRNALFPDFWPPTYP